MTRKSLFVFPLILSLISLVPNAAHAAKVTAASCSSVDVQNAINSAASGDTVLVPGPCSSAWSSRVPIPGSKGITVDGGGATTLSRYGFDISQNASTSTRVTGFIFTNGQPAPNDYPLTAGGSSSSAPFRIDHNKFSTTGGNNTFITVGGNAPGLIDHNTFYSSGAPNEFIHNMGMGASSSSGWTDDVTPGNSNMLFIEDNTFTFDAAACSCNSGAPYYFWGASAVQSYYGARTVVRYNTMNMTQVDQHGTPGAIGARWWEIYGNTFNVIANGNQSSYMAIRAGSGIIFGNHKAGATNLGGGQIELFEEDSGYPALYQIGRGVNQNLSPAYVWGNDASMPVSGGTNVVQGRDFMVSSSQPSTLQRQELRSDTPSTTYAYKPFTYPHPLQSTSTSTGPVAPQGLSAAVQ
jgi:hypothetical protein